MKPGTRTQRYTRILKKFPEVVRTSPSVTTQGPLLDQIEAAVMFCATRDENLTLRADGNEALVRDLKQQLDIIREVAGNFQDEVSLLKVRLDQLTQRNRELTDALIQANLALRS